MGGRIFGIIGIIGIIGKTGTIGATSETGETAGSYSGATMFEKLLNGLRYGPLELLVLQPTSFCNLDCSYCYLPDRSINQKMSIQVVEKLVDRLRCLSAVEGDFTVVWHSGEPLAAGVQFFEQACEVLSHLNRPLVRLSHSVQTNGTLINDSWCELFKKYMFRIGVSVDGPEHIHDAFRRGRSGTGSHRKVLSGIEKLRENDLDFHVIAVLTALSIEAPNEIFDFFRELRPTVVAFNVEEKEGVNRVSSLSGSESMRERVRDFFCKMDELNEKAGRPLSIREVDGAVRSLRSRDPRFANVYRQVGNQENSIFRILSVDATGNFSTFSPELLGFKSEDETSFTLGNIFETSFDAALRTAKFKEMNRQVRRGIAKCRRECSYFEMCGGGSPGNKFFELGSFSGTRTVHCELHKMAPIDAMLKRILEQPSEGPLL